MKQIFEKRYTKRGVRSFKVTDKGREFVLVFDDLDANSFVFREVSSFEAQEDLAYKLTERGVPVLLRAFASSVGNEEYYLRGSGFTQFEEVVV